MTIDGGGTAADGLATGGMASDGPATDSQTTEGLASDGLAVKVKTENWQEHARISAGGLRELVHRIGGADDRFLVVQRIPDVPDGTNTAAGSTSWNTGRAATGSSGRSSPTGSGSPRR